MVASTEKHIGYLGREGAAAIGATTPKRFVGSHLVARLLLGQKLALLVAATAVPAIVLGCLYFQQTAAAARQARSELGGTRYIKALASVAGELLTHRGREYAFLNGDKARRADVISQAAEVDSQIAAVDKIDAELGEKLGVSQDWQSVKSEWATLESNGLQRSAEESDAAHAALDGHLGRITENISSRSLTSVDPDVSTRALLRIASSHAPELMLYSSNMRSHAVRAASKGYLGGDDRMGIRIFRDRQQVELDSLKGALEQVSPDERAAVEEAVTAARTTADEFYGTVQAKILNAANMEISGGSIYDAGVPTNRALKKVSLVSYEALTKAVGQRLARTNQHRLVTAASTALALCLALGLSLLVTRSLSRPLHHAVSVFGRISAGNYENEIAVSGTDEASQVLGALDRMQGTLRTQIETERGVAAENSRIRHALDKASTSVLLADGQHRIIYLNDTAQKTFASAQGEIRKTLPGFDVRGLRGSTLDTLSSDPSRERRTLDALTGSEVQERALGSLTLRTVSSPVVGDNGERIGTVVEWTDRTQEVGIEKEMQTMLSAVINGDLASRIALDSKSGFFETASRGINQLADNMAEIVAMVKDASAEVYRGSKEIANGNSNLQQRTEEQSASLEETASSMEEMTTTVRQNADNAGEANQLALAARAQAEQGGNVVNKAVHAMSEINESARKIADIIGVIDEIAFQTNLLALNAAVEAARAGEQGRGFAVVATEVRTLAGRSATAAKEIKNLIKDSVKKVEDGSVYVTRSGQTLEQIVASVKKVSDIVAEIAAASREQSAGIGQVNQAVLQMDELTQQNAALVEQATSASQAMAHEAHALHEMMGSYQLGDLVRNHTAAGVIRVGTKPAASAAGDRTNEQPAPRSERRGSVPRSRASGSAQVAAAAADGDSEWQEF
ncbi:MAG: methyl-accepting chemotaxis protein [Gammaproteobacteria bacterium]|nr:methyl-accepting chemotaxis protein [Gammaproteobacteria bacterium]